MLDPGSLRGRLTLAYAAALVASLILFAALAVAVVDAAQRRMLDAQLATISNALHVVGDVKAGELKVDASDRRQFDIIIGAKADAAIVTPGGVAVSSDRRLAALLAAANQMRLPAAFGDSWNGTQHLRVFGEPIVLENGSTAGRILVWRDLDSIAALDRSIALAFALAIPGIVALAVLAGGAIARQGLEPLEAIARLSSEIEARDLSKRIALGRTDDELGRLGATFNRMLDRLQRAFDRERRFTSDASHEIRAPLSVIRAEADLALLRPRSHEEYRRVLETIAAEADELELLTCDLLAAARAEQHGEERRTLVSLAQLAGAVVSRLHVLAAGRQIRLGATESVNVFVVADRAMLERAVVGVCHNALKFAPQGGTVSLHVGCADGRAELAIADDGPGFSEAALRRAFDRFWRDDEARASEGSGLGLTLAKAVVERYGGTVTLENAVPHGAIVRLRFAAAPSVAEDAPALAG